MKHPRYCRVCLGECDAEIHAATVNVHRWLRERVRLAITPLKEGKKTKRRVFGTPQTIGRVPQIVEEISA